MKFGSKEPKEPMNHIDEQTLELYLLEAREVNAQREEIKRHLKECAGCAALYKKLREYYGEVEQIKAERAEKRSRALTVQRMIVRIPPFNGRMPISEIPKTFPARVVYLVIQHPVISSTSFLAIVLATLLLLAPKFEKKDLNPSYARAKDEFLIAYNESGDELWKKHIGFGYAAIDPSQVLAIEDVDGDGKNEILATFGWIPRSPMLNAVVCYNADGRERWKYEFHRHMTFGEETFSDDYRFVSMMVGDFERDGSYEVVAVIRHNPYWPCAIVRLDARNGTLLSEYWHSGWIESLNHKDIDGDGVEELFFAGENNSFDLPSLIVLDPRNMEGHAPAKDKFVPQGVQKGKEKYYILLPPPDLRTLAPRARNYAALLTFPADGSIDIREHTGLEPLSPPIAEVVFSFDRSLNCLKATPTDDFKVFHRRMEAEGKLTKKVDEHYSEELRQGVQYWDGKKFVHEPTMNKRYREMRKNKLLP